MNKRSSALLTKSQREALLEGLGTKSSHRKLRQRLRTRAYDSTIDLRLLFSRLDDDDIEDAFRTDVTPIDELGQQLHSLSNLTYEVSQNLRRIQPLDEFESLLYDYEEYLGEIRSQRDELGELSESVQDQNVNSTLQTRQDDLKARISELEDELRFIKREIAHESIELRGDLLEIKDQVQEIVESLNSISDSFDLFHLFLDGEYHTFKEIIKESRADHKELFEKVERSIKQLESIEETFSTDDSAQYDALPQVEGRLKTVAELREPLDEYIEKYGRRRNIPAHSRREDFHHLRDAVALLRRRLRGSSFPPEMRENIVKSLGFYLRVSDIAGADLESVLEDAITATISRHREDEVLDYASVNIETEQREKALERGKEKLGNNRLSNAELRAIAESDTESFVDFNGIDKYSLEDQILERLLEDPSIIETEFEFTDVEPSIEYHDLPVRIDLLGKTSNDITTLVNIETDPSDKLSDEIKRMRLLVNAFDEPDNEVRGIIVVPQEVAESETSQIAVNATSVDVRFV